MSSEITLKIASPFDENVQALVGELDRYQRGLYPPECNYLDPPDVLAQSNCKLLGAYMDGILVGIGAAKIMDGYGELKRFFISEHARGLGIGDLIIAELENWLLENGITTGRLETGIYQPAAIRFYEKQGYRVCEAYGEYRPDPLNVFMEKTLLNGSGPG